MLRPKSKLALEKPGKPAEMPRLMILCIWKMARLGGLLAWAACAASAASAQTSLEQSRKAADELEKRLPVPEMPVEGAQDMGVERQQRFRERLPESGRKLSQREPFHLVVLGDAAPVWQEPEAPEAAATFDEVFAQELAALFFYTGGVRRPEEAGRPEMLGPAITLRHLGRPGGSVLDAPGILASTARQTPVDLVVLCLGQGEAGMSPAAVAEAVRTALDAARGLGAEVLLAASWPPMGTAAERLLGQGRRAADVLAEIAEGEGLPLVDLGSLRGLLDVPSLQPGGDVAHWFAEVERLYRGFFYESASGFIPRASLHRKLGTKLLERLLTAPPESFWQLENAVASLDEAGTSFSLTCGVKNLTDQPMDLVALPLIAGGWRPVEVAPLEQLGPGATARLEVRFTRDEPVLVDEPLLRVPLLLSAGGLLDLTAVRAPLQPLAIVWECETFFNQDAVITPACTLVNASEKPLKGTWLATLGREEISGAYAVPAGGRQALELRFRLPEDAPRELPLTVKLGGDAKVQAARSIHLSPNLGLGVARALVADKAELDGKISLQAGASASHLQITLSIPAGLITDPPSGPAWELALNLDARSYGKRLEPGSTVALRMAGGSVDGPGAVSAVAAWAFGTGYAAQFESAEFKAELLSSGDGGRQIRLTLPRTYLYLHEWAMDNGNSQLGINLRLRLHGADGVAHFQLSPTRKPVDDVSALVVLELAAQPTRRYTVSVE